MKTNYMILLGILLIFAISAYAVKDNTLSWGTNLASDEKSVRSITTPDGKELVLDEQSAKVTLDGVQSDWIDDGLFYPEGVKAGSGELTGSGRGFVHKAYYDQDGNVSLDIYIEETFYYNNNSAALDDFWDKFNERFELLKNRTGWSSKRWFGVPLEIYNYGHSAACYGGNASPTHSNVVFSDPMYKNGCNKPYYTEFNSSSSYYNNPGELGDWWPYMNTAIHEAQHSISPYPIYTRSWLTEGFSEYLMYNVLTEIVPGNSIPDINQETADTYLYKGFAGYQWDPYVANDYHDTTIYNRELQRSHGYDITGWLISKLIKEQGMNESLFYSIINNNKDSLDRTFSLGPPYIYYVDAYIVNVFGRAIGHTDYWNQTDPMFNYYSGGGEFGHGYGARNISYTGIPNGPAMPYADFDWFAEYNSNISASDSAPEEGEEVTIYATVYNTGDVNGKNISVRIYADQQLLEEQYHNINKNSYISLSVPYTAELGNQTIEVRVDEDNTKIEQDENNNDALMVITGEYGPTAPVLEPLEDMVSGEMRTVSIYPSASDVNEDDLTYEIDSEWFDWVDDHFEWTTTAFSSGNYTFTVSVTDGMFWDSQLVNLVVIDNCQRFYKQYWKWDCELKHVVEITEPNENME